jgi:hypothetical protein
MDEGAWCGGVVVVTSRNVVALVSRGPSSRISMLIAAGTGKEKYCKRESADAGAGTQTQWH